MALQYMTAGEIYTALMAGTITSGEAVNQLVANVGWSLESAQAWVPAVVASKPAPAPAPAPPVPVPQPIAQPPGDPGQAIGEDAPFAAFLRRNNLPGYGQNPLQSWQMRQYDPTYATYQASSYLNPLSTPPDWNAYQGAQPAGSIGNRAAAMPLFRQAMGQTPQEQNAFRQAMDDDFDAFIKNILRGRYASPVAQRMGQWLPGLQQQFRGTQVEDPNASFLSFLNQKLRLGG